MREKTKPVDNDPVPPRWKFVVGSIFVLVTLGFMALTTFLGPQSFGYAAASSAIIVQSVFAGAAFTLFIDGSMSLETRQKLGGLTVFALRATGGGAFAVFAALVSLHYAQNLTPYELRLYLTDEYDRPIEEADVKAEGADVIVNKADHGWRLILPASSLPPDGKFVILASNRNIFLKGRGEVTLDKNRSQTMNLQMSHDRSAVVSGRVVEEGGLVAIQGAKVFVDGNEAEAVLTDTHGSFDVKARAAPGEYVHVHAEKQGFRNKDVPTATDQRVQIALQRSN